MTRSQARIRTWTAPGGDGACALAGLAVEGGGPHEGVAAVVGEGGQSVAGSGVRHPAEWPELALPDCLTTGLAPVAAAFSESRVRFRMGPTSARRLLKLADPDWLVVHAVVR
jgi:hypothetical protein